MRPFKYFDLREFRSPDSDGSGQFMNMEFVKLLDEARGIAGTPFKITSGFRTWEHNNHLIAMGYKASPNSSHLKGLAADIAVTNKAQRHKILTALMQVGLNRFGVADNFIHVDMDPSKPSNEIWVY